jgi:hypothetical protein
MPVPIRSKLEGSGVTVGLFLCPWPSEDLPSSSYTKAAMLGVRLAARKTEELPALADTVPKSTNTINHPDCFVSIRNSLPGLHTRTGLSASLLSEQFARQLARHPNLL